jgi:uncharacterized protein YecE (DUF72 family)
MRNRLCNPQAAIRRHINVFVQGGSDEHAGQEVPVEVTADFVYIRLHGPYGPYQRSYSDAALRTWAKRIAAWAKEGLDVYYYFDNDDRGFAPRNALRLRELVAARIER